MKLTKRIFVAVLAIALVASAFIFSVSAEEFTFRGTGIGDIEDILEYYTFDQYLADNYDDGTWTDEYMVTDNDWAASKGYPNIEVTTVTNPHPLQ